MISKAYIEKLGSSFRKPQRLGAFRMEAEEAMALTRYQVPQNFAKALLNEEIVKRYVYVTKGNKSISLYTSADLDECSSYEIALALQPRGYFCNATAIYYHQLTDQVPATVYICFETIPQIRKKKIITLSDNDIRKAFISKHRVTKLTYKRDKLKVTIVDREQNTRYGVTEITASNGLLPKGSYVANLERALIDAVINPQYNGGISNVYSYYKHAGKNIDMKNLISIYTRMKLTYPYSQVIGFFLERVGQQKKAKELKMKFPPRNKFYVSHEAKSSWLYDDKWKIYYPNRLIDED